MPAILLGPCALPDSPDTRGLARCIAGRDIGIGLAMALAPAGPARRTAVAARVVGDWGDALALGVALRGRGTASKVTAFALVWGALCAAAGIADERG